MGFDAIWISPVVENSAGGYHGYWASNWNAINHYFGSA
jgi:alpha-amylase